MNSTTTQPRLQQNSVNTTLLFTTIRHQVGDIESQALAAQTLCEIAFEELDSITSGDPEVARVVLRLDALIKGVYRNDVLNQEATDSIRGLLAEVEGGVQ